VPHQEIHGTRLRRNLILGDAVVAVQRRRRISFDFAADCKSALLVDDELRCGRQADEERDGTGECGE
jgi:hypothetical protein